MKIEERSVEEGMQHGKDGMPGLTHTNAGEKERELLEGVKQWSSSFRDEMIAMKNRNRQAMDYNNSRTALGRGLNDIYSISYCADMTNGRFLQHMPIRLV